MVKKMEIPLNVRYHIVGLYKGGLSQRDISKIVFVPRSTIQSILKRWLVNGTTENRARSGRPNKLTEFEISEKNHKGK